MTRKLIMAAVLLASLAPAIASATTPAVNGAVVRERIFNDCPTSVVTSTNFYPASITISDYEVSCFGYANLHNWRFSEDGGVTPAVFYNDSQFRMHATLVVSGTAEGESGLQISPWWSQDVDGRLNVRTSDGEIACFGGRLPFFSFTGTYGLRYVKGTPIYLEIAYHPNGLAEGDPATIQYIVGYDGATYDSGWLPFDMGNPSEEVPYGLWGMLNEARVGGHLQVFLQPGVPGAALTAEWSDIWFNAGPTATMPMSWGNVKTLYR